MFPEPYILFSFFEGTALDFSFGFILSSVTVLAFSGPLCGCGRRCHFRV